MRLDPLHIMLSAFAELVRIDQPAEALAVQINQIRSLVHALGKRIEPAVEFNINLHLLTANLGWRTCNISEQDIREIKPEMAGQWLTDDELAALYKSVDSVFEKAGY